LGKAIPEAIRRIHLYVADITEVQFLEDEKTQSPAQGAGQGPGNSAVNPWLTIKAGRAD
jgi:hypothetical protein